MPETIPTIEEVATGAFLHDMGKLLQRAGVPLNQPTRNLESVILPTSSGFPTHKHALWTEAFFDWIDSRYLRFPVGVDRAAIRNVAVYHHRPDSGVAAVGPAAWISAEADRLAAGMDRRERDEAQERSGSDAYIRTALLTPFAAADIGRGEAGGSWCTAKVPLGELRPDESVIPQARLDTSDYRERYRRLWEQMQPELEAAFTLPSADLFLESLLSISERFLFAVPSSTVDQPDISLHDHNRAAAAIAAAMYRWHQATGTLTPEAVRDRAAGKYRFVSGDLSGIQDSLFRLASQQVRGVNKILRARSFLMSALLETAALLCRRALGLPVFCTLSIAGGRFVLLAANTPDFEEKLQDVRRSIESWMFERYLGELALNVEGSPAFSGADLLKDRFAVTWASMKADQEEAKLHAFSTCLRPVHVLAYPVGPCTACGERPAAAQTGTNDALPRCGPCEDEHLVGGVLPRASAVAWSESAEGGTAVDLFGGLRLHVLDHVPSSLNAFVSFARFFGAEGGQAGTALRFVANHVPRITPEDDARYSTPAFQSLLSEEAVASRIGDVKTFEHLAADCAVETAGGLRGAPLLAVIKADVDRLGQLFGSLREQSLGRFASLSRTMDFFFTGYLTRLLGREFRNTYTVYAGGDDLLLIAPWRDALNLALALHRHLGRWTGGNPNVTLSAGLELVKVGQPLNRAAADAEERLDAAKQGGRDRICAIDRRPVTWTEFEAQLEAAGDLYRWLDQGSIGSVLLHKLLYFDGQRRRAEAQGDREQAGAEARLDLAAASWRARWGYTLARNVRDRIKDAALPAATPAGIRAPVWTGFVGSRGRRRVCQNRLRQAPNAVPQAQL